MVYLVLVKVEISISSLVTNNLSGLGHQWTYGWELVSHQEVVRAGKLFLCEGSAEMFNLTKFNINEPIPQKEGKTDFSQDLFGNSWFLVVLY